MSHTKIYLLVHQGRERSGHGETAPYVKLGVTEGYTNKVHPAFRSRQNAEEYADAWEKKNWVRPEVFEVNLI